MKYLIVDADFRSTGIRDEFKGDLTKNELKLSDKLWNELSAWVEKYSKIIPLDISEREKKKINKLDEEGFKLIEKIKNELNEEIKIRYYSEGKLKFIEKI